MILEGLRTLTKEMRVNNLERYKISFKFNNVAFDVFYFIDEAPFILMFGVKAYNFYFEIKVKKGFQINPRLNNYDYYKLLEILNLNSSSNNPFKPQYFFEEFNKKIPLKINLNEKPKPHEIAQFRKDVEESERIYFLGWRDNTLRNEKVSPENLKKTKALLERSAYERCRLKNISSRWTDDFKLAQDYYPPD